MTRVRFRCRLMTAGSVLLLLPGLSIAAQSLVDAARKEAERRSRVEELGIEEIVIEGNGESYSREGNVSVFTRSEIKPVKASATTSSSKKSSSLSRYRKTLQKLDGDIRKEEEHLRRLGDRLENLRRESHKLGDLSKRRRNEESQDRTREQIEEATGNLELMKKERRDVYDAGRKEGFLPGELDGKGIIP